MSESILELDEDLGFCTSIEVTKSSLFSQGISVTSEVFEDDACLFSVSVPPATSKEFAQLCSIISGNSSRQAEEMDRAAPMLIEVPYSKNILSWSSERQAKFASALANRFLRAYEHTYFDVWVPRHRLDGRTIVMIAPEEQRRLEYTPVMLDLNDILEHYLPSHVDVEKLHLGYMMGLPDSISSSWRILIDGTRHFENGNLREAVLCACSSAEIVASPAVEYWLEKNTLAGGNGVRNAVREMGNPLRFDLCISGACSNAFVDVEEKERRDLLTELRHMNSLRNAVVHQGEEPEATAAAAALQAAAKFVCKNWLATLGL
ncbi:hypothetical protein [Phormidesmis sp. 146-33]